MDLNSLINMVDHEIQWLNHYSLESSRDKIDINSEVYDVLKDIGYSKVTTDLKTRCSYCTLTNGSEITENTDIGTIVVKGVGMYHLEFHYTPLEVFWILFKDKRIDIVSKLRPIHTPWEPWIFNR